MNRQALIIGIVVAVLVAAGAVIWALRSGAPPASEAPQTVTDEDRAEDARDVIADLEQGGSVDYDAAFERAQEFRDSGRLADAQLLYFFGARGGHAPSAFELATMNDPNHHTPETSLLPEPDPFQAYRWYAAARDQGMTAAGPRLEALRDWAEKASASGNAEAERLLLQWE